MKTMRLGKSDLQVPVIAVGCMRINDLELPAAERFIRMAMELGANFFDHADIYGRGACEEIFAQAIGMNSSLREKMFYNPSVVSYRDKCSIFQRNIYSIRLINLSKG